MKYVLEWIYRRYSNVKLSVRYDLRGYGGCQNKYWRDIGLVVTRKERCPYFKELNSATMKLKGALLLNCQH